MCAYTSLFLADKPTTSWVSPNHCSVISKHLPTGKHLASDAATRAEPLRRYSDRYRGQPSFPPSHRAETEAGLPQLVEKIQCRERHVIKHPFGWLEEHHRLATPYFNGHIGLLPAVLATPHFSQYLSKHITNEHRYRLISPKFSRPLLIMPGL